LEGEATTGNLSSQFWHRLPGSFYLGKAFFYYLGFRLNVFQVIFQPGNPLFPRWEVPVERTFVKSALLTRASTGLVMPIRLTMSTHTVHPLSSVVCGLKRDS
jgi:hypothetical protein